MSTTCRRQAHFALPVEAVYDSLMSHLGRKGDVLFPAAWDVVELEEMRTPGGQRAWWIVGYTRKFINQSGFDSIMHILFTVQLIEVTFDQTEVRVTVSHPGGHFDPDDPRTPASHIGLYRRCLRTAEALLDHCESPYSGPAGAADFIRRLFGGEKEKRKRG